MDIPSLFMIPSAVSSGKVHSVFPNSTDADFDFNRDSDATRVNSEGLIERVGYYGSEEITNGDFSNGYVGWSLSGNPSNYSVEVVDYAGRTNALHFTTTGANEGINQNVLQSSTTYYVRFDLKVISGSVYVGKNSARVTNADLSPSEWTTYAVNWTSADTYFRVYSATVGAEFYVDNISVKEVTGDRARLNYEIERGLVNTKPSFLLEPQSTNLLTYSEDFSDSSWTSQAVGSTVTSNSIVSPDGTLNADTIQGNGSSTFVHIRKNINLTTASHTFSIFAKKGTNNFLAVQAQYYSGATNTAVIFDLNNRIVTSGSGNIEDYGNEWLKCSYTVVISSDVTGRFLIGLAYNGTTIEFPSTLTANGKNIYIYGAQLEQLSYSTSYIPTNGSVQSRASETCNGAGTSSILPSEEGILYAEIAAIADDSTLKSVCISDGSTANRVIINYSNASNRFTVDVRVGSVGQAFMQTFSFTITDFLKIALKYKLNDFALYINGSEIATDTSGSVFSAGTLNTLSFDNGAGGEDFYGKVRDIRVYNTKEMTDSEVDILLTKITS